MQNSSLMLWSVLHQNMQTKIYVVHLFWGYILAIPMFLNLEKNKWQSADFTKQTTFNDDLQSPSITTLKPQGFYFGWSQFIYWTILQFNIGNTFFRLIVLHESSRREKYRKFLWWNILLNKFYRLFDKETHFNWLYALEENISKHTITLQMIGAQHEKCVVYKV